MSEQLTELGKTVYLPDWFIKKAIIQEQMKEMQRAMYGEAHSFHALSKYATFPALPWIWKFSEHLVQFYEGFIMEAQLIKWLIFSD